MDETEATISKTLNKVNDLLLEHRAVNLIPEDIDNMDLKKIFTALKNATCVTARQTRQNELLDQLILLVKNSVIKSFAQKVYNDLLCLYKDSTKKKIAVESQTKFYQSYHQYIQSEDFLKKADTLFVQESTPIEIEIAKKVAWEIKCQIIADEAKLVTDNTVDPLDTEPSEKDDADFNDAVRGVVRHISGFIVHSLKADCIKALKSSRNWKSDREGIEKAYGQLLILESFEENDLISLWETTNDPESLTETARRQNKRLGLTNVKDSLYYLIFDLTKLMKNWLCEKSLEKHK